jgi:hypothetical protein
LGTKATTQALKECVLRRHYERAVTALGAEIEQKTPQSHTQALADRLQDVEAQTARDAERLAVAMRFVEWFTSRGECYEHNIKVIDKHLKGLLVSPSAPLGTAPGTSVHVDGVGGVSLAAGSSHVHTYYMPGHRLAFDAQPDHAR